MVYCRTKPDARAAAHSLFPASIHLCRTPQPLGDHDIEGAQILLVAHGQPPVDFDERKEPRAAHIDGWNRHRERFLETCRNTCKLHEVIGFEEMLSHEFLSADRLLQRTRFAGGATVVANFGAEAQPYRDGLWRPSAEN